MIKKTYEEIKDWECTQSGLLINPETKTLYMIEKIDNNNFNLYEVVEDD